MKLARRRLLGLASSAAVLGASGAAHAADELAAIERQHGGRLGVFADGGSSGRSLQWRADELFPMESTFKAPLAALTLHRVQSGADTLSAMIEYGRADLLPVSPVTEAHVAEGRLSIASLVAAILERSDNTAANLLLAHVGGPTALTSYLRDLGDHVTTIRRGEVIDAPEEGGNTTSPRAFASTIRTLCTGDALQPSLRTLLLAGMTGNRPGLNRLRASFPAGWRSADRTGTGDGICNDCAVAWTGGATPIVVSVFYRAPGMALDAQESVLRTVGRLAAAHLG